MIFYVNKKMEKSAKNDNTFNIQLTKFNNNCIRMQLSMGYVLHHQH